MSGEIQLKVQIRHSVGDTMSKLTHVSGSGGSTGMHSSGGSTGEDSSGEEPMHHVILPKKTRLKEPNNNTLSSIKSSPSLMSLICHGGNKEMLNVDDNSQDQDDEDSVDVSAKESGNSASLTSEENSDAEMGPDGDGEDSVHMKSEDSSKKMFECDVCNMRFSNGANMRRHRMRHSGIKPFECKICQKRFFRKDHLAEHMATHSKLLPFRCPICNKGFQRQIAMRAHFQNEHVGGSQDMVKACPLCSYKAGSMKSLRVHFYSRHGIDLDNPMPHSPSLICSSNGRSIGSPGPTNHGEFSELAHALGFEDREKSSDSSMIPSHFLVPQIEISSNSSYPAHFAFTADSSYTFNHDERRRGKGNATPTQTISPQSDSGSNLPSSSDLVTIVVKKELMDDTSLEESGGYKPTDLLNINDDIQDMPEDLSSGNGTSYRSDHSPKNISSSVVKVSALTSLLREDWRSKEKSQTHGDKSRYSSKNRSDSTSGHSTTSALQNQSCDGEAISSSNGCESGTVTGRRGLQFPACGKYLCLYCGITFPDKTLYFLHKGCHSESNPWRCNICGESCTNVYDFNSHLLSKSHQ